MLQPLSSSSRVLMIGLSSSELTPIEQSVIARWTDPAAADGRPRGRKRRDLGHARPAAPGAGRSRAAARRRHVTLSQVIDTAGNAQVVSPLSYPGGLDAGHRRLHRDAASSGCRCATCSRRSPIPSSLGKVPVEDTGGRLELADVRDVNVDHQPLIGDAVVNDGTGLLLVVEKFPGANTARGHQRRRARAREASPRAAGLQTDTAVFRPADFLEDALNNLTLTLIGPRCCCCSRWPRCCFHWRTVLIVVATIPVALVAAAWVLDLLGESFNAISFAGLALALAGGHRRGDRGGETRSPSACAGGRDTSTEDAVLGCARRVGALAARCYATLIALLRDRAGRRHGRPAGRVLRPAGARIRRRRGAGHAGGGDPRPGPQPAAVSRGGRRPGANRPSPGSCCPATGGCWARDRRADPGR